MNLAVRDIRHNFSRFAFTTVGIGLLLMVVMGMAGIYRGLIFEATLLVDRIGADLWVVQGYTRGPFAELSRIPVNLEDRVRAIPEIIRARRFVNHSIQREHHGEPLRLMVQGLAWPDDKGEWVSLVAGRSLGVKPAGVQQVPFTNPGLRTGLYLYRLRMLDPASREVRGAVAGKMMLVN